MNLAFHKRPIDEHLQDWARCHRFEDKIEGYQVGVLIVDARFDLNFGHHGTSDTYPGWSEAIRLIKAYLDTLPATIYFDTDSGEVFESKPRDHDCGPCPDCDGTGDHATADSELGWSCDSCGGTGRDILHPSEFIESRDTASIIAGADLVEYL